MWLVLSNANDAAALWAYRGLKARGLQPVEIIGAESLVYSASLRHRIEANRASTEIRLADGRVLESASVRGTLNRLYSLPCEHLRAADATDRQYAEQELYALFLSWLHALPGKTLNRPAPQGLCGAWLQHSKWLWLAARAGLKTNVFRQGSKIDEKTSVALSNNPAQTVVVLGEETFGANAPENVRQSCVRFAQTCGAELLGVDFKISARDEWIFAGATPLPDLRIGGEPLLDALFEVFIR